MAKLTPIVLWYSVENCGDGSAYPRFYLTEEETEYEQNNMDEGWGEPCNGSVDSYEGSGTHDAAIENSRALKARRGVKGKDRAAAEAWLKESGIGYHISNDGRGTGVGLWVNKNDTVEIF